MKFHRCLHAKAETRTHEIPGSASGRWVTCSASEPGAVQNGDAPGSWHRWEVTGSPKSYTTHKHVLPAGAAERISHVTTRFGHLPQGAGVVHWVIEDGHLIVRPALDLDLGIEAHLRDEEEADHG